MQFLRRVYRRSVTAANRRRLVNLPHLDRVHRVEHDLVPLLARLAYVVLLPAIIVITRLLQIQDIADLSTTYALLILLGFIHSCHLIARMDL